MPFQATLDARFLTPGLLRIPVTKWVRVCVRVRVRVTKWVRVSVRVRVRVRVTKWVSVSVRVRED